jgi:hypothetical protein
MTAKENTQVIEPVTKGERYGLYNWAVDITVPSDWDGQKDKNYSKEALGVESREELSKCIVSALEDYHGSLTFAYRFLTGQRCELSACAFHHLPLSSKVEMLKKLLQQRSQDEDYRERFDCDLRRFLDVERICMPVLERYVLSSETVWRRELVDVINAIRATMFDFSESMACEHDYCPQYFSVDRHDPPLPSGSAISKKEMITKRRKQEART